MIAIGLYDDQRMEKILFKAVPCSIIALQFIWFSLLSEVKQAHSKNLKHGLGMVVIHAFNPPSPQSQAQVSLRPPLLKFHLGLHSGTLPQKTKQKETWSEKSLKIFLRYNRQIKIVYILRLSNFMF